MLKGVALQDRITVPSKRQMTDAGQMIVPCAFARTGVQQYSAGQLGLKGVAADKIINVYRDEADVFDEASVSTFRSAPVTIGHPKDDNGAALLVDAKNAKELQVGFLEGMPARDEDTLTGTLIIARQDAIDIIEDGIQELSAGYTCDLEMVDSPDGEPMIYQRNIKANHIAIVERGRAGRTCAIADEAETKEADMLTDELQEVESVEPVAPVEVEAVVEAVVEVADEVEVAEVVEADEKAITLDEHVAVVDELAATKITVAELNDKLELAEKASADLQYSMDKQVAELVRVIGVAKDLTDIDDFSGKSAAEIMRAVVADQKPTLNLDGKSEAYISARFDVITEDAAAGEGETPMGRLLRDNAESVKLEVKPDPVAVARQNMINRSVKR